jgi:hypothetical protein
MDDLGYYLNDYGVWSLMDQSYDEWDEAVTDVPAFSSAVQEFVVQAVKHGVEAHQSARFMMAFLEEDDVFDSLTHGGLVLVSDWEPVIFDMPYVNEGSISMLSKWRNAKGDVMNVLLYDTRGEFSNVLISADNIAEVFTREIKRHNRGG